MDHKAISGLDIDLSATHANSGDGVRKSQFFRAGMCLLAEEFIGLDLGDFKIRSVAYPIAKLNFVAADRDDVTDQLICLAVVQGSDIGRVEYGGELPVANNGCALLRSLKMRRGPADH